MIPRWVELLLFATVALGLLVAFWAGPNLAAAIPAAAIASLGAAAYAGLLLEERVRRVPAPLPVLGGDPVVGLRESFRSGPIGRQSIIQLIATMERSLGSRGSAPITPAEELRLLNGSRAEFRTWVAGRIQRLERET
ncbi:MAG: hypothetical protein L3K19_00425 [Thermoplasmata archaeon]|nr:hypothetical protein [Thermoplasmata archaeon]